MALLNLDKEAAMASAKKLEGSDSEGIILSLADLYAQSGDPAHLPYLESKFDKIGGFSQYGFIESYATLAAEADAPDMLRAAEKLKSVAMNDSKIFWIRFLSTKSINDLHAAISNRSGEADEAAQTMLSETDGKIISILEEITKWESDERVLGMYGQFPDPALKP